MRLNPLPPPYIRDGREVKRKKIKFLIIISIIIILGLFAIYKLALNDKDVVKEDDNESIIKRESKLVKANKTTNEKKKFLTQKEKEKLEELEKDKFLFSSDKELLTEENLDKWDLETIKMVKNEIFARHGYIFREDELNAYFNEKSWYKPNKNFAPSDLNDTEKENIKIILKYLERVESLDKNETE